MRYLDVRAGVVVFGSGLGRGGFSSMPGLEEAVVYQQLARPAMEDGKTAVLGSWLVDGEPAGIGIRESVGLVTTNVSRFVPHLFSGLRNRASPLFATVSGSAKMRLDGYVERCAGNQKNSEQDQHPCFVLFDISLKTTAVGKVPQSRKPREQEATYDEDGGRNGYRIREELSISDQEQRKHEVRYIQCGFPIILSGLFGLGIGFMRKGGCIHWLILIPLP